MRRLWLGLYTRPPAGSRSKSLSAAAMRVPAIWATTALLARLLPLAAPAQTTSIVRTVEAGQLDLISIPLHLSPTNTFGVAANDAPIGSTVFFFDDSSANFMPSYKSPKGWPPSSTSNRVVMPGESFFLRAPEAAGYQMTLEGEPPAGPVEIQIHERWSVLGYPYPRTIAWTDTELASLLPTGTLVYFWDRNAQSVITFQKGPVARGGWGAASNHLIQPGDGFIVRQPPGSASFGWGE